jgi:hypothetical protein
MSCLQGRFDQLGHGGVRAAVMGLAPAGDAFVGRDLHDHASRFTAVPMPSATRSAAESETTWGKP